MSWIFLSILSAFGQAFSWALKKKTLENKGVNNTLGAVSFIVAGIILVFLWGVKNNWILPVVTERFIFAALVVIILNIVAVWTGYRALDKAALSMLMPFIAFTSLTIVPIEYFLRGVSPNLLQIIGIAIVVIGAILFSAREFPKKETLTAAGYFTVTIICYSITSPYMAVAVEESGNGLFSAAIFHIGIAAGFIPLIVMAKESATIQTLHAKGEWKKVILLMILSGMAVAILENGPATVALETAKASEVFALKRTMPFFSLVLGIMMFGEKITKQHVIGTSLLVLGSGLIVWFR